MSVKKNKPYSTPKRTVKKKNNTNKSFDVTTRIRVDEIRLNDSDSLDTSFLEGRVERQAKKDTKKVKEKILRDNSKKIKYLDILKKLLFSIALVTCIVLLSIYLFNYIKDNRIFKNTSKTDNTEKKTSKNEANVIDDNYLLVGDYYIDSFDIKKYDLDYHYVKSTSKDLTTSKLIDDIDSLVYKYNPSIVFLEVGMYDLNDDIDINKIVENYEKIINLIKENRPFADIIVESLIPINRDTSNFDDDFFSDDLDNDDIKELNSKLKELAESKKVTYIDLYSMLEKDGKLDSEYTSNGIALNDNGYNQMLKMIKKYTTKD